jgi:hypothetical protein
MKTEHLHQLLYEALETEMGGAPEEEKDVKTAIGAARAKQSRTEML